MINVVNEVLGDTDPNDRVRFAISSSNFDRALNTMYQPRSEVTGVALAELFGKLLQSNQSIDIDNNLTLHVQRVNLPRGNGNTKRKLAGNVGLNLILVHVVEPPPGKLESTHMVPRTPACKWWKKMSTLTHYSSELLLPRHQGL